MALIVLFFQKLAHDVGHVVQAESVDLVLDVLYLGAWLEFLQFLFKINHIHAPNVFMHPRQGGGLSPMRVEPSRLPQSARPHTTPPVFWMTSQSEIIQRPATSDAQHPEFVVLNKYLNFNEFRM